MKILSWNILAFEFIEKEYYPNLDYNFLTNRLARIGVIANKIQEVNADIILLQEVMMDEYFFLKSRFRQFFFSKLCHIDWNEKSESGNVILYRKTKLADCSSGETKLYESNCCFGQHLCFISNDQQKIHVFNIHLNDLFHQKRKAQINSILYLLQQYHHVILGGDFNENYDQNQSLFTIPDYTVHNKNASYYIESFMNIDNILTKGFGLVTPHVPVDYTLIPKSELLATFASDHLPVFTTILYH